MRVRILLSSDGDTTVSVALLHLFKSLFFTVLQFLVHQKLKLRLQDDAVGVTGTGDSTIATKGKRDKQKNNEKRGAQLSHHRIANSVDSLLQFFLLRTVGVLSLSLLSFMLFCSLAKKQRRQVFFARRQHGRTGTFERLDRGQDVVVYHP